jgi:hypothetical protein
VGSLAYLAYGDNGLVIIDTSNPSNPVQVGYYNGSGSIIDVQVVGNIAYIADYGGTEYSGLTILDISNPSTPIEIYRYWQYSINKVFVLNNTAFIGGNYGSISLVDISEPESPKRIGFSSWFGPTQALTISGSFLYAAAKNNGLMIFSMSTVQNSITVTSPTKGELWKMGSEYNITWTLTGVIDLVRIELYVNNKFFQAVDFSGGGNGIYGWEVHRYLHTSSKYQIKIVDYYDETAFGFSNYFSIYSDEESPFNIPGYNMILLFTFSIGVFLILVMQMKSKRRRYGNEK